MLYFTHGAVRSKWLHCWGNVVEKFSLPKSPPPPPRCVFRTADLQTNKWGQFPELFTLMISNNGPPPAPCKIWCLDVQYNMNNNIQFRTIFRTIHDNLHVWVRGRCHHNAGWRGPLILLVSADQLRYIPALNHLSRLQPRVIRVPRVLWNMMDRTHIQGQDVLIGSLLYMRSKETT